LHKCHNYHAILHKLYSGKNQVRLYLNGAKKNFDWGAAAPVAPSKYAPEFRCFNTHLNRLGKAGFGCLFSIVKINITVVLYVLIIILLFHTLNAV